MIQPKFLYFCLLSRLTHYPAGLTSLYFHCAVEEQRKAIMSKKYPECPLYNHSSCRDCGNPKVCAI